MTDVFLSYAREDRAAVERLAEALGVAGVAVWWDRNLTGGVDFSRELERRLDQAKAIVVAWSKSSVESMWVSDEANVGREKGNLVPIVIDPVLPKIGFRGIHTLDLSNWRGDAAAPEFQDLVRALKARVSGETPATAVMAKRGGWRSTRRRKIVVAVAAAGCALAGTLLFFQVPRKAGYPPPVQAAPGDLAAVAAVSSASIAVLPFADMSEKKDQEYFADGMAEEILNVLARVDGLKVASRTSSFAFKSQPGTSAPIIARDLGVRNLLEGSVRKSGDTVRITVQLIDTAQDAHLWSQTFDRPLTTGNLFAIQDDVAKSVVAALRDAIGARVGDAAPAPARTNNVDAYGLFLRARALFNARRDLNAADRLLEQALGLDPNFADALAIRSAVREFGGQYGAEFGEYEKSRQAGRTFAQQALAIDPRNSLALAVTGLYAIRDHMKGQPALPYEQIFGTFDRALALDPKNSNALHWKAFSLFYVGEVSAALAVHRRCVEVEPTMSACRLALVSELLSLGRRGDAAAALDDATRSGALAPSLLTMLVVADLEQRQAFRFLALGVSDLRGWQDPDGLYDAITRPGDHRVIATKLKALLEYNHAWLDSYSLLNAIGNYERPLLNSATMWIGVMRPYRQSPEFKQHVRASGLYDYWGQHGFPPQCRARGNADFACD